VTIIAAGFVFLPPPYGPAVNIGVVIYTIEMLRKCASMNDTYHIVILLPTQIVVVVKSNNTRW
jgi:hypothetical protein